MAEQPRSKRSERVLDEYLVLRAQEGNAEAFGQLVTRWQERLWRHAHRLTGRESAAWDVLQESWIGVYKGIAKLRDPAAFGCWAYTIVTRAAAARRRGLLPEDTSSTGVLDTHPAAEPDDERSRAVARLRAALSRLERDEQALLSLRYFEEFELWELARILDVPQGTVKSRLHAARNRLKDILERMQ